jgi:hypothetical protein
MLWKSKKEKKPKIEVHFYLKNGRILKIPADDISIDHNNGTISGYKIAGMPANQETLLAVTVSEIAAITYKRLK